MLTRGHDDSSVHVWAINDSTSLNALRTEVLQERDNILPVGWKYLWHPVDLSIAQVNVGFSASRLRHL